MNENNGQKGEFDEFNSNEWLWYL